MIYIVIAVSYGPRARLRDTPAAPLLGRAGGGRGEGEGKGREEAGDEEGERGIRWGGGGEERKNKKGDTRKIRKKEKKQEI